MSSSSSLPVIRADLLPEGLGRCHDVVTAGEIGLKPAETRRRGIVGSPPYSRIALHTSFKSVSRWRVPTD